MIAWTIARVVPPSIPERSLTKLLSILTLVEGETPQSIEGGVSGSEIIHGDDNSEPAQGVQNRDVRRVIRQEDGFRDFQLKPLPRQPALGQAAADVTLLVVRRTKVRDRAWPATISRPFGLIIGKDAGARATGSDREKLAPASRLRYGRGRLICHTGLITRN